MAGYHNLDPKCDVTPAFLTRVKDAQNRAGLYSVNETRVSSTRHNAILHLCNTTAK